MNNTVWRSVILGVHLKWVRLQALHASSVARSVTSSRALWNAFPLTRHPITCLVTLTIVVGGVLLNNYVSSGMWFSAPPAPHHISPQMLWVADAVSALCLIIIVFLLIFCIAPVIFRATHKDFSVPAGDLDRFQVWLSAQSDDLQKLAPPVQHLTQTDIKRLHHLASLSDTYQERQAQWSKKELIDELGKEERNHPQSTRRRL